MSSLGKGLESLIPPKKNTGQGDGDDNSVVPATPPSSATAGNVYSGHHNSGQQSFPTHEEKPPIEQDGAHGEDTGFLLSGETLPPTKKDEGPKQGEAIFYIEVDDIIPNREQPRTTFDEGALTGLATSIREFGILQPLVVSKVEKEVPSGTKVEYELIAGHRRLLAAKKIGLERVPAVVRSAGLNRERLELAVIENIQREDLNPIEMARAFARLQDEFRLTQREIASRLGKSRETIANTLRLLDLTTDMQEAIERGGITSSHGRILLSVDSPELQRQAFEMAVSKDMTTRDLKNAIRALRRQAEDGRQQAPSSKRKTSQGVSPRTMAIAERLSERLGAPVDIKERGERGNIMIRFYSQEELDALAQKLAAEEGELFE